jgi:transcriptional/translational regulatory protein YebC/TACO1
MDVIVQSEMVPQKLESEEKLIEIMEDDDDVQNIWHNWEE